VTTEGIEQVGVRITHTEEGKIIWSPYSRIDEFGVSSEAGPASSGET